MERAGITMLRKANLRQVLPWSHEH